MQRLDKYLSDAGVGTRKEIRQWIRQGRVTVNGKTVTDESRKPADGAEICLDGSPVRPWRIAVGVLHKPVGFVTSTEDPRDRTVMDLLPAEYRRLGLVPVGRLDKDTSGLLLFTNDGNLAHRLISPKYRIEKEYLATVDGVLTAGDVDAFAAGLTLRDGTVCLPARLELTSPGACRVTLTEGKYHQVRRMLASRGAPVITLCRLREGTLRLGDLPAGAFRELTETEVNNLLSAENNREE